MSSLILTKATAVGTLVLGAAALSGCTSDPSNGSSAGATQSVSVAAGSSTGATAGGSGTSTGAAGAATGTGGTSTQAAGGGSAAGDCTGGQLTLKIAQGSSGMGHTGSVLVFTNTGSSTCSLSGYPGAEVTDDGQYNWASRMNATRVSGVNVGTVSLAPGASASAMLEWDVNPSTGAGDQASAANCAGMAGGYLEITAPNTTVTHKSEPPLDMCTQLQVYPVVAGATGQ
jgi:hypothetical protein